MHSLTQLKVRTALLAVLLAGGISAITAPTTAQAQSQEKVRFQTPFGFEYGNTHLPAGTYIVRTETSHVTLLRSSSTAANALTTMEQNDGRADTNKGKVVFRRYGNRYFLREVWMTGQSSHLTCARTKAEKQAEIASKRTIAADEQGATNVELAMLEVSR